MAYPKHPRPTVPTGEQFARSVVYEGLSYASAAARLHVGAKTAAKWVSRVLRRNGINRLRSLGPPLPVVGYGYEHPGSLIHFDLKRLAKIVQAGHRVHGDRTHQTRGAGYEYLHIAMACPERS